MINTVKKVCKEDLKLQDLETYLTCSAWEAVADKKARALRKLNP